MATRTQVARMSLGIRVLVGMAVGAVLGALLGPRAALVQPVGDLFIRLLVLAAVPLIFFNLLAGITSLTDVRVLGRLTAKILVLFAVTAVVASALGVAAMLLLRPGVGMTVNMTPPQNVGPPPTLLQVVLDLVPTNMVRAFSEGNVLQIVVVSVLLGVATLLLAEEPRDRLRAVFADLAALLRKVVELVLIAAPYGIGALMAATVGRYGAQLFGPMMRFVLGVNGALLLMVGIYMALIVAFSRYRPLRFLKDGGPVWATTIATTSSLASLPVALEVAEKIGLPRSVYSFVLPLGNQINKDGTAIALAAIVVFTAQAAGVPLSGADLFRVVFLASLLSAGSGGIPAGGFVVALVMVEALGLPLEVATIVGGIYRLVDMGSTTVNVMGDLVGTIVVVGSEGQPSSSPASVTSAVPSA